MGVDLGPGGGGGHSTHIVSEVGEDSALAGRLAYCRFSVVDNGFCRHVWAGPPDATRDWALGLFTTEFTYTLSLVLIKLSLLALYWRIFSIQLLDKLLLCTLIVLVICWGIAAQFDPVHPTDPSTFSCGVDIHKLFVGKSIPHIITDVLILLFPLPYIWNLRLRKSQKIATVGVFLVGML
ncbi:hypothetical protein Trco_007849 [Trichoderma cornu-damae]|uniref:Rhodopsin domain-containing protein n=1 Tax=Trichoderma cornu-damae TaxID=654480 RepID=A0A9P8TTL4_9HYPO|nr:hypothetical protein Trco_007849 [Trichoderma cornu-damae]